jgi:hypothetical protein
MELNWIVVIVVIIVLIVIIIIIIIIRIWGSHTGGYENLYLVGYNTV